MRRPAASGLFLGPGLFVVLLLLPPPEAMPVEAWRTAAMAAWMAVWWITEAIPIPATALLPIAAFPLLGIMPATEVTRSYAHHLVFLFMGGFMIALTMERWNLHRRIALHVIRRVGTSPPRLVLGFMLATALLSMWISNTATTMLMVTIAMAVLKQLLPTSRDDLQPMGTALMLSIAYAASIGGIATIIGTAPNAILVGVLEQSHGVQMAFGEWMQFALPLALVMLFLTWLYLTRVAFRLQTLELPETSEHIRSEVLALGHMGQAEKRVAVVFLLVAGLWVTRGLVDWPPLNAVRDSTIAMVGALALFVIPADWKERVFLLDWPTAVRLPWDIIVLFGGGFALAAGFSESGLTVWLAGQLRVLQGIPLIWLILAVGLLVIFLTELTSNTATVSLLYPVLGALAEAVQIPPAIILVTAAISASFAFMLPVATPPNAIVFASHMIHVQQMARAGLWLNIMGVFLITAFVYLWLPEFR